MKPFIDFKAVKSVSSGRSYLGSSKACLKPENCNFSNCNKCPGWNGRSYVCLSCIIFLMDKYPLRTTRALPGCAEVWLKWEKLSFN